MGIAQDLRVAARRWVQVRRAPSPAAAGAAEREQLRQWFTALRSTSGAPHVRDARIFDIEASRVPWLDTGIDLDEGEWVSTLAAGRVVVSDRLDLWLGAQFQLWMRVGERGTIFNGTRDTHSFRAAASGRLYLAGCFPGQWGDASGRISTSLAEYQKFCGGITVAVIRWNGEAGDALAALAGAAQGGEWFAREHARLCAPVAPPLGWDYLWLLGRSEIFRSTSDAGHPCIACDTQGNVSILQHDVAFDLSAGTRLGWSWKVDELPSILPENTALSHDYLSVAVEFENGRDITYTWSPELAAGTGYWCPLPTWKDREFHVVVRSGGERLGTWLDERRDLEADYRRFIGEPPRRIVRVWLIAVSLFQRRRGRAFFRDFTLEGGPDGRRLEIG